MATPWGLGNSAQHICLCLHTHAADGDPAVSSRWCEESKNASCCLPCPMSYWVWKDVTCKPTTARRHPDECELTLLDLIDDAQVALWPGIPVIVALVWLLLTYAIFPANMTDCHYLSVSPLIGFFCITVCILRLLVVAGSFKGSD